MMRFALSVAGALALALPTAPIETALAGTKLSTKTVYYTVQGKTPAEMATYMIRNGPHGERGRAMGTTTARISQHVDLRQQGGICVVRAHILKVDISMHLPKLAAGQKVSATVRSLFNGLAAYVRQHENHHKNVFVTCANRIDQRVRALPTTSSCNAVRNRIRRIFNEENARCDAIHGAYDRREASRVRQLPFIRKAFAPQTPVRRTITQSRSKTRTTSLVAGELWK